MRRWFRPVAYSLIALLGALAIFGKPPVEANDEATVQPLRTASPSRRINRATEATTASVLRTRDTDSMLVDLFDGVAEAESVAAQPAADVAPAVAPPPELKILGWMESGGLPTVFVQYANESYTLTPSQSVDGVFRFEKIGGGQAEFTYLPTGESRQYAVSDPALSE